MSSEPLLPESKLPHPEGRQESSSWQAFRWEIALGREPGPGLGTPAVCLGRATFWTARGPREGRPMAIQHPRSAPQSQISFTLHRVPANLKLNRLSDATFKGASENHILGFFTENPEKLGARAVAVTAP